MPLEELLLETNSLLRRLLEFEEKRLAQETQAREEANKRMDEIRAKSEKMLASSLGKAAASADGEELPVEDRWTRAMEESKRKSEEARKKSDEYTAAVLEVHETQCQLLREILAKLSN